MVTKKLRNFEFAYRSQDFKGTEQAREAGNIKKTLNGYAFVLCNTVSNELKDTTAADLAMERILYYLDNEFVEDPIEAVNNAIVYANGFIYEYARKNTQLEGMSTACICGIIRDNRVYYGSVGGNSLFFFDGKKLYPLAYNLSENIESDDGYYLGTNKAITPGLCEHPFIPVENDKLLICSERFLTNVSEKSLKNILSDPMPLLTKVSRLADLYIKQSDEDSVTIQLLSFYNIEHDERHFSPSTGNKEQTIFDKIWMPKLIKHPIGNFAIIAAIVLFFLYMVYDLFLYNPSPGRKVEITQQVDKIKDEPDSINEEVTSKVFIPDDTIYPVKSGDTWGKIYQQFSVCSWFIRNHKPNAGKFDRSGNPVAGTRLNIPIIYSSKQELNPDFYMEFSTDKVGSACQNANSVFLKTFENIKSERLK